MSNSIKSTYGYKRLIGSSRFGLYVDHLGFFLRWQSIRDIFSERTGHHGIQHLR